MAGATYNPQDFEVVGPASEGAGSAPAAYNPQEFELVQVDVGEPERSWTDRIGEKLNKLRPALERRLATAGSPYAASPGMVMTPEQAVAAANVLPRVPGEIARSIGAQATEYVAGAGQAWADFEAASARRDAERALARGDTEVTDRKSAINLRQSAEADRLAGIAAEARQGGAEALAPDAGPVERAVVHGLSSAAISLPTVLAAGPVGGAAVLGAGSGGARYSELRAAGKDQATAAKSGALLGSLEALTEFLPGKALTAAAKGSGPLRQALVDFVSTELVGENATTIAQIVDDYAQGLRDDVTVQDVAEALRDTTLATAVGGGAQLSVGAAMRAARNRANVKAAARAEEPKEAAPTLPPDMAGYEVVAGPGEAPPPAVNPDNRATSPPDSGDTQSPPYTPPGVGPGDVRVPEGPDVVGQPKAENPPVAPPETPATPQGPVSPPATVATVATFAGATPAYRAHNPETNVEGQVRSRPDGRFAVVLWDHDAGRVVGDTVRIFRDEAAAQAYARKVAGLGEAAPTAAPKAPPRTIVPAPPAPAVSTAPPTESPFAVQSGGLPVYTGRADASGEGWGATRGSLSEGTQQTLLIDRSGNYFWGEKKLASKRDVGRVILGAHRDYETAKFASTAEARAAAQRTTATAPADPATEVPQAPQAPTTASPPVVPPAGPDVEKPAGPAGTPEVSVTRQPGTSRTRIADEIGRADESTRFAADKLASFVQRVASNPLDNRSVEIIATVDESKRQDIIDRTGVDVGLSAREQVRANTVRHAQREHPDLTVDDWRVLPWLTSHYDDARLVRPRGGDQGPRIAFVATDADSGYAYVAEVLASVKKGERLTVVTFFKDHPNSVRSYLRTNAVERRGEGADAVGGVSHSPKSGPVGAGPSSGHPSPEGSIAQGGSSQIPISERPVTPPPAAPRSLSDRLTEPRVRDDLAALRNQAGWAEVGGRLIRSFDDSRGESDGHLIGGGKVIGRTKWLPRVDWWLDRPKGVTERHVHAAVDAALSGQKLKPSQVRIIEFLLDVAESQRRDAATATADPDFTQSLTDLLSDAPSQQDLADAALTARAVAIDEDTVERLAQQYEDDSHGFIQAIRNFLATHDENAGAPAGRTSDQREASRAESQRDIFGGGDRTGVNEKAARVARKLGKGRGAVAPDAAPPGDIFREASDRAAAQAKAGQSDLVSAAAKARQPDVQVLAEIVNAYEDGDTELSSPAAVASAIADRAEEMPTGALTAADRFLREVENDYREHGGRGDAGAYEQEFMDELHKLLGDDVEGMAARAGPGAAYVPTLQSAGAPSVPTPFTIAGETRMATAPKAPIRREHVMEEFQRLFGIKVYQGKPFKGKMVGFFRPKTGEIRVKARNDLEVTAHEVFHWIDRKYPSIRKLYHEKRFHDELTSISYDATKLNEGFAEFGRLFMTQQIEAVSKTPEFFDAFVAETKALGIYDELARVQLRMHEWYLQGAEARALSKIGAKSPGPSQRLAIALNRWGDRAIQAVVDYAHSVKMLEREISGAPGPAYEAVRLLAGARNIANQFVNYGTLRWAPNGDLEFSGEGLRQIFEPSE